MYRLEPVRKGYCCLCEHVTSLEDAEICLCGDVSLVNGEIEDVQAEVTWTCEKCGNKVKYIDRVKVVAE